MAAVGLIGCVVHNVNYYHQTCINRMPYYDGGPVSVFMSADDGGIVFGSSIGVADQATAISGYQGVGVICSQGQGTKQGYDSKATSEQLYVDRKRAKDEGIWDDDGGDE